MFEMLYGRWKIENRNRLLYTTGRRKNVGSKSPASHFTTPKACSQCPKNKIGPALPVLRSKHLILLYPGVRVTYQSEYGQGVGVIVADSVG